ncbi:hypothetical protein QJS66_05890 [Kocuria rhizophila]|nr:hypothetical protein QJS66_05890 [Kocuria rhizophila]
MLAFDSGRLEDEERRFYLEPRSAAWPTWPGRRARDVRQAGWRKDKLVPLHTALDSWDRRIPTGRLNAFLGEMAPPTHTRARRQAAPHPRHAGRLRPPKFVLFTTGFLDPATAGSSSAASASLARGAPRLEVAVRVRDAQTLRPASSAGGPSSGFSGAAHCRGGTGTTPPGPGQAGRRRGGGGGGGARGRCENGDRVGSCLPSVRRWFPRAERRSRDVAQLGGALDWGSGSQVQIL